MKTIRGILLCGLSIALTACGPGAVETAPITITSTAPTPLSADDDPVDRALRATAPPQDGVPPRPGPATDRPTPTMTPAALPDDAPPSAKKLPEPGSGATPATAAVGECSVIDKAAEPDLDKLFGNCLQHPAESYKAMTTTSNHVSVYEEHDAPTSARSIWQSDGKAAVMVGDGAIYRRAASEPWRLAEDGVDHTTEDYSEFQRSLFHVYFYDLADTCRGWEAEKHKDGSRTFHCKRANQGPALSATFDEQLRPVLLRMEVNKGADGSFTMERRYWDVGVRTTLTLDPQAKRVGA